MRTWWAADAVRYDRDPQRVARRSGVTLDASVCGVRYESAIMTEVEVLELLALVGGEGRPDDYANRCQLVVIHACRIRREDPTINEVKDVHKRGGRKKVKLSRTRNTAWGQRARAARS